LIRSGIMWELGSKIRRHALFLQLPEDDKMDKL